MKSDLGVYVFLIGIMIMLVMIGDMMTSKVLREMEHIHAHAHVITIFTKNIMPTLEQ